MTITASMVRELRERSGAGMMECKKALEATGGDLEGAFDWLRKQGLKAAEKKADRTMGEGRIHAVLSEDGRTGAMVAVTCETDFVARTPDFEGLLQGLGEHLLEHRPDDVETLLGQTYAPTGTSVEEAMKLVVGKLGENIQVGRLSVQTAPKGYVGNYVHHNHKVGVLVSVETDADAQRAAAALKELAMHAAFSAPTGVTREDVSKEDLERERAIYLEEVKSKPAEMQDKIVQGKLEKFYAGRLLPEQPWFKDDKQTVQAALEAALGGKAEIQGFARYQIGG